MFRILWRILYTSLICIGLLVLYFYVDARLRETETRFESAPPSGKYVQSAGLEIFVQEMGPPSGPAVLLIPATAAWSGTWEKTAEALAASGYRVVAIDLPPFGYSERPYDLSFDRTSQAKRIRGALDALNIEKVTLVGHSIAGRPTIELALLSPERVERLVLVSASAGITKHVEGIQPQSFSAFLIKAVFGFKPVRDRLMDIITYPMLSRTFLERIVEDPSDVTYEIVSLFRQPFSLQKSGAALGDWLFAVVFGEDEGKSKDEQEYGALTMPTLLVWGREDKIIPLAEGERLQTLIKNSELVVMEGVNHAPHLEETEFFNTTLIEFLKTH